jgi:hypothetical protein
MFVQPSNRKNRKRHGVDVVIVVFVIVVMVVVFKMEVVNVNEDCVFDMYQLYFAPLFRKLCLI